jgi:Asp-tRNA(Asn)/Glu-tRNA(Gln) amidotransferase A subunit family amidase
VAGGDTSGVQRRGAERRGGDVQVESSILQAPLLARPVACKSLVATLETYKVRNWWFQRLLSLKRVNLCPYDEMRAAWSAAAEACESLGATVVPVSLPHTAAALAAYYIVAPAEASSNLARYDGIRFGAAGPAAAPAGAAEAAAAVTVAAGEALGVGGETSATAAAGDAFHAAVAAARTAGFGPEVQRRVLVGTYTLGTDLTARYFERAQR